MAENKEDYAIVIGINGYSQLRRLRAAHKDAAKFAEWLKSPAGGDLPPENVRLIVSPEDLPADPLDAEPVKKHIDRALRDFGIAKNQRIGRRLYFYFAGHGFGPTFDDVGMLMADAAMDRLNSNLGLRPYRLYFRDHLLWDEIVYILDCCRDPTPVETAIQLGAPAFTAPKNMGVVQDYVVMAAAYGAKAFEPTDAETGERRGLLTQALMEALGGKAVDAQNRITASAIREYLKKRVRELATEEKLRQDPEIPALPDTEMIFGKVALENLAKLRVQVVAVAGLVGDLILRHGSDLSELARRSAQLITNDQPWEIELPRNSRYLIEHADTGAAQVIDPNTVNAEPFVVRLRP